MIYDSQQKLSAAEICIHLETQGGSVAAMDISAASWRIQGDGAEITGSDSASNQGVVVLSIDRSTGATQHWVIFTGRLALAKQGDNRIGSLHPSVYP